MQPSNSNTDFQEAPEARLSSPLGQLPEQFEVLSQIGQGGMGVVYKARNKFTDRIVAIKMLPASVYSEQALMRFQREAKAISAFTHANAVALYDFGLCSDQSPYFVMEFVEGENLGARLERTTRLDEKAVLEIFTQVCAVLIHAHEAGVIHRDLKPSNFMITDKNVVKILDFGIAKIVKPEAIEEQKDIGEREREIKRAADEQEQEGEAESQKFGRYGTHVDLTTTGAVMGTPLYMSPEQCLGGSVDARTDIYSMGAVMYHCLTGVPPHLGTTIFETLHKRMTEAPEPFDPALNISSKLQKVVLQCLDRNTANRPQTANVLLEQLNACQPSNLQKEHRKKKYKIGAILPWALLIFAMASVSIIAWRSVQIIPRAPNVVLNAPPAPANAPTPAVQRATDRSDGIVHLTGRSLSPEEWKAIGQSPGVTQLNLANSNLTNETFAYLKGLHDVKDVDVSNTRFTDLPALVDSFPLLKSLNLLRINLSGPSTQALSKLSALKEIDVSRTKIDARGFSALQKLDKLEKLRFVCSGISDETYEAIAHLKQLKSLDLWKTNTNDHKLRLLAPLKNLTELRMGYMPITDSALDTVAQFPLLEKLEVNGDHAIDDKGFLKLKGLKHLKKLSLAETQITDKSADVLSHMTSLRDLNLRETKIGDKGLKALAKLTSLEKLNIKRTNVNNDERIAIQALFPKLKIEQ